MIPNIYRYSALLVFSSGEFKITREFDDLGTVDTYLQVTSERICYAIPLRRDESARGYEWLTEGGEWTWSGSVFAVPRPAVMGARPRRLEGGMSGPMVSETATRRGFRVRAEGRPDRLGVWVYRSSILVGAARGREPLFIRIGPCQTIGEASGLAYRRLHIELAGGITDGRELPPEPALLPPWRPPVAEAAR